MNYSDFLSQIRCQVELRMGGQASVSIQPVLKNNDLHLDGLLIMQPGENITPTIYLNDYYEEYLSGASMQDILSDIECVYEAHRCPASFDVALFQDFERLKGKIAFRLINRAANKTLLEDLPFIPFLDLAVVFYFTIENDFIGSSTALIHRRHMELWETTAEELYLLAFSNTRSHYGCEIRPMEQLIREILERDGGSFLNKDLSVSDCLSAGTADSSPEKKPVNPMYILTNRERAFGAVCLLYDEVLQKFADELNDDFYVLPSSIHEVILLPCKKSPSPDSLQNMVREINETDVAPDEVLSDHIYVYRAAGRHLGLVLFSREKICCH
ncbi:DUF5688 family protein [Lacrimispora sp. NSJ-141]|uniref:DUF5688 family protein n=1 Tax=Lientehia hominis TaxID=2897778 RepID=A0AAP2RGQ1_9FIRM|nr:DUF5688 family protein [Lientehia hominis]MCD2491601.1 DUF5688 family protein [Lientehia hominis]